MSPGLSIPVQSVEAQNGASSPRNGTNNSGQPVLPTHTGAADIESPNWILSAMREATASQEYHSSARFRPASPIR